MPTIVGILTFMGVINFMLSCTEHDNSFITLLPDHSKPGPEVTKHLLMDTIFTTHKSKMMNNKDSSCFEFSDVVFILLINVKTPTIVGILILMSKIHVTFVLS